jgi:GAF domain-containing protein
MLLAPMPVNEPQRLDVLRKLGILDTPSELCFNVAVSLAAKSLKTPIAAVSLVDRNRQWFKAIQGLSVAETPRDIAFCAQAILDRAPLIVNNALDDERFCNNRLVTEAPHIRSYMGMPLTVQNVNVGTLCVIDYVPRQFDNTQVKVLRKLANMDELFLMAKGPR